MNVRSHTVHVAYDKKIALMYRPTQICHIYCDCRNYFIVEIALADFTVGYGPKHFLINQLFQKVFGECFNVNLTQIHAF